jgi:hypothetical protein
MSLSKTRVVIVGAWHVGTFDVSSCNASGTPRAIPLKTHAVKLVEDRVYVES